MAHPDNIDLFICTHKPFECKVTDPAYKVLYAGEDFDCPIPSYKVGKTDLPHDDKFYSELYHLHWAAQNLELKDYVGVCHYRRYFGFLDDVPDVSDFVPITAIPFGLNGTMSDAFKHFHNIDDLILGGEIIKEHFPEYYDAFNKMMNNQWMIPCNMFIVSKEDFYEWDRLVAGVGKIIGERIPDYIEHINNNKEKYLKDFAPNNTVEYQQRIGGYVLERLTNVFFIKHYENIHFAHQILTEYKYDSEKL